MATARKATARSKKHAKKKSQPKKSKADRSGSGPSQVFETKFVHVDSIQPYEKNPRVIPEAAVRKVAMLLRRHGWQQIINVDRRGVIVAGHTRLAAAKSLGWTTVPVHVNTNRAADVRSYRLADNRSADESSFDDALVSEELAALRREDYDLSLTAFDESEIDDYLDTTGPFKDGVDLDEAPSLPKVAVTKLGDRILLGRHVLVCGDATDPEAWRLALGGRTVGMYWTDPPYAVGYVGKTKEALTIDNDAIDPVALDTLLRDAFRLALANQRVGGAWYVSAPAGPMHLVFARVLSELGVWRQSLVWIKDRFVLGRSDYHYRHEAIFAGEKDQETIFYGWQLGAAHTWESDRRQDTVCECPRPSSSREHPTMKPIALVQPHIEHSAAEGDLVFDPFGGSGTTMLAAEAADRSSALIELSPQYCDVIVGRWEAATGQTAVRPSSAPAPKPKRRQRAREAAQ